jgi:hypothetical protein
MLKLYSEKLEIKSMIENAKNTWTDPDDAPELEDEFFQQADQYDGEVLVKRGSSAGSGINKPD